MNRRFFCIRRAMAVCLIVALAACTACAEDLVELSCGRVEFLNYQCTMPDGRLLLTGGTRRAESGGDAAWIMCLNTDRSVSWEYISRKDGYTAADYAAVLPDGTAAVVMENYPEKRAVMFFTPDGKKARKKLNLKKKRGNVCAAGPSFIMFYDSDSDEPTDWRYTTFLYDWTGKETGRYDGVILRGGYGFMVSAGDEFLMYGQDTMFNSRAMIQKLDGPQGNVVWETVLDRQEPGTDTAVLDYVLKTADGGYIAWLREGKPGEADSPYVWTHSMVKFDAEGHVEWIRGKELNGLHGKMLEYGGKIGIMYEESSRIDASRTIHWYNTDGTELGTTELKLDPKEFTVLRDYLEPEEAGEQKTSFVDQLQFIPMEDGLWAMATCFAATDVGGGSFATVYDSQEIVMFRIPVL